MLEAYRNNADELDYEAYDERIELWNKYIKIAKARGYMEPQEDGYQELAKVYDDMENYEKAIECYTMAINLGLREGSWFYSYVFRANIYIKIGKYNEAIADYSKLIEMGYNYHTNRAECYYEYFNDVENAIADYSMNIKKSEESAYIDFAYKQRAAFYCKIKNYKDAVKDYTSAIKEIQRLFQYFSNKSFDDMVEESNSRFFGKERLEKDVQNSIKNYRYERGIAYYELQMYDEAISDFKIFKEEDPQYADAKKYINKALLEKGNKLVEG